MKIIKNIFLTIIIVILIVIIWYLTEKDKNVENSSNTNIITADTSNETANETFQSYNNMKNNKFELKNQNDDLVNLESYRGKKVILIYWQIWCPPCREELKVLDEVYQELGNNQEDVILLTATKPKIGQNDYGDDKTIDEIKQYLLENNHQFPVLFDTEKALSSRFTVHSFPTTIILDEDGNEVNRKDGEKLSKEKIYALIN